MKVSPSARSSVKQTLSNRGVRLSPFRMVGEVWDELRKVVWPTRDEVIRLTGLVVGLAAVIGVLLGLIDFGFNGVLTRFFIDS